ncbi:hypothetical protein H1D32_13010 [Anaerobacillus sp. CMMVII]|uniref:hypothetical protein n=1 Tax=Anaerobacillus sp. CMMVII TaxID=2755588 RepID=UPI0021B72969|nr:hypothetical protein [Anaerobacillus sp. CMMVII]MCT8138579.1 hypothetical protein [Anaerobacillus sp. CMMVII]
MNKIVFLLPVSVMVLLFYFGYQYVNNMETATNESLQNDITISLETTRNGNDVRLTGKWDWTQMPVDGLVGDDYIMISLKTEEGTPVSMEELVEAELFLFNGKELLVTITGELEDDGVVFTFPNQIIDHVSYGNRGEIEVSYQLDEEQEYIATFTYVHTWVDHELVKFDLFHSLDAGLPDILTNKYWSINRFIQF